MKIYLIRHGKVEYKWLEWYSSKEFDNACSEYDDADIIGISEKINLPDSAEHLTPK